MQQLCYQLLIALFNGLSDIKELHFCNHNDIDGICLNPSYLVLDGSLVSDCSLNIQVFVVLCGLRMEGVLGHANLQ